MWDLTTPWWEIMIRAAVIYFGVFLLFRCIGKKQLGEMSPFDFVLLLIVSEAVSNGLTGGDESLSAGLICASTLIVISFAIDRLSFKFKKFETLMDGKPQIIVDHGEVNRKVQKKALVTDDELKECLRKHGLEHLHQVKYAIIETNGEITIIKKDSAG